MTTAEGQIFVVHPAAPRRDLLCRRLQEAGYVTRPADAAADVLKAVRAEEPEVVVLGVECCMAEPALALIAGMQAEAVTGAIPVIVLAPPDADLVQRCLDAGAADFLHEPHSPSVLKSMVDEYRALSVRRRQEMRRAEREDLLKIERDVQIARQIQEGFLPNVLPQPSGWDTAARFHPAREVAGDFYDGFELSQGRRVALVIADVCDKGVGAALFMALFRSLYRAYAQQNYSMRWTDVMTSKISGDSARQRAAPQTGSAALKNAMDLTNKYMTEVHASANMFATTFFAVLDPSSGQLAYVNGGHNPPVVVAADGSLKARLKPTGPAVGLFPDVEYRIEQVKLEPGDVLFTFTDGVTDARNPDGTLFGEPRMLNLLGQPCASAGDLLDRVDTALRTHIGSASQFDDITMLALRRAPQS